MSSNSINQTSNFNNKEGQNKDKSGQISLHQANNANKNDNPDDKKSNQMNLHNNPDNNDDQNDKENIINKIDQRLGEYYNWLGKNDYFDREGNGKFKTWCEDNGFEKYDINDVKEELQGKLKDCAFLDYDSSFPLPTNYSYKNNDKERTVAMFEILKNIVNNDNHEWWDLNNPFSGKNDDTIVTPSDCSYSDAIPMYKIGYLEYILEAFPELKKHNDTFIEKKLGFVSDEKEKEFNKTSSSSSEIKEIIKRTLAYVNSTVILGSGNRNVVPNREEKEVKEFTEKEIKRRKELIIRMRRQAEVSKIFEGRCSLETIYEKWDLKDEACITRDMFYDSDEFYISQMERLEDPELPLYNCNLLILTANLTKASRIGNCNELCSLFLYHLWKKYGNKFKRLELVKYNRDIDHVFCILNRKEDSCL